MNFFNDIFCAFKNKLPSFSDKIEACRNKNSFLKSWIEIDGLRKEPNRIIGIFSIGLKIIITLLLITMTTAVIFIGLFLFYVKISLIPQLDITFEDYALEQTSFLFCKNGDGEPELWTNIMSTEQRTWLDYDELPQYMIDAVVAIEDKRFFVHDGVDWYRTAGAMYTMFFGSDNFGASTITQQLIKNLTGEDDITVRRKIIEIFRALEAEKFYSKEEIITWYLNVVYMGETTYGVEAASKAYFGKSARDLTLAECACIIGITNRPTAYNPYHSKADNIERQRTILREMYSQGYISYSEYTEAVNEELAFVRGENEEAPCHIYSYYEEVAITDAIKAIAQEKDLSEEAAKTLVFNGGLRIYTCIDLSIQEKLDSIYTDLENIPATTGSDQQLQSAMTIQDPETGYIVALVGGVGEKEINFGLNRATGTTRPPGSSIKPLSVYGPALDLGIISVNSTYQDAPINSNGKQWPRNDSGKWSYSYYNITSAVRASTNTIAVGVTQDLGIDSSYYYLSERLGITTLDEIRDKFLAPLALGQLTNGIKVREMTSAFCAIANGGRYIKSKTFYEIRDSRDEIFLDNNRPTADTAFSAWTTDTLTALLYNAVQNGTGRAAILSGGMAVAGKTGTTGENYDRWFCGFTPYYAAACWTGYDLPESIRPVAGGNPAAQIWNKVMTLVHDSLEVKTSFEQKSTGEDIPASVTEKTRASASSKTPPLLEEDAPPSSDEPIGIDEHSTEPVHSDEVPEISAPEPSTVPVPSSEQIPPDEPPPSIPPVSPSPTEQPSDNVPTQDQAENTS